MIPYMNKQIDLLTETINLYSYYTNKLYNYNYL